MPSSSSSTLILIVDDSEANRMLLAFLLEELGFDVAQAENGEQAVEVALEIDCQVVFMDINMPVMNGIEATSLLRGINFNKPIIACTAEDTPEKLAEFKEKGLNDYISKPIELEDIQKILKKFDITATNDSVEDKEYQQKIEQLTHRFLNNIPVVLAKIDRAIEVNSLSDLKRIAHKLKGTASTYGFDKISILGKDIELAINKSKIPMAIEKTQFLKNELQKLLKQHKAA